jgi:hypothetical protein
MEQSDNKPGAYLSIGKSSLFRARMVAEQAFGKMAELADFRLSISPMKSTQGINSILVLTRRYDRAKSMI